MGLHHGVGEHHHAGKYQAHPQHRQEISGCGQSIPGVSPEQSHNGLRQDDEAHRAGHGDETHNADGRLLRPAGPPGVAQGELGGNRRQNADGNGGHKGIRQVKNGLCKVVHPLERIRLPLGKPGCPNEPGHDHLGIHQGDDLQSRW